MNYQRQYKSKLFYTRLKARTILYLKKQKNPIPLTEIWEKFNKNRFSKDDYYYVLNSLKSEPAVGIWFDFDSKCQYIKHYTMSTDEVLKTKADILWFNRL